MKKRTLPLQLKGLIFLSRNRIIAIMALAILLFTLPHSLEDWQRHFALKGNTKVADGEITYAWTIQEETEEDWPVYGYEYVFFNNEIGQYSGVGFATNQHLKKGEKIRVLYNTESPYYNKASILKSTRQPIENSLIWFGFMLFPVLYIVFSSFGAYRNIRAIERGEFRIGKRKKKKVYQKHDYYTTYEFTYEYESLNGKKALDKTITHHENRMKRKTTMVTFGKKIVYVSQMPVSVDKYIHKELIKRS